MAGVPIADLTSGFVIYTRPLLKQILKHGIKADGYAYQMEMKALAFKLGASFTEIPIIFKEREGGVSKLSGWVVLEGVLAPWRLRFAARGRMAK